MRRLAIYPGSFDPLTLGHVDVIERASELFDHLIVSVGANSSKAPLLTAEERMEVARQSLKHLENVEIDQFSGLLMDYAHGRGAKVIVRGLRATADFEYEFQMATVNRKLSGGLETVFLMTKWEHSFLSSTMVKELAKLGGDFKSMVPEPAEAMVTKVLARRQK